MADGKRTPSDVAGCDKWERFEDEVAAQHTTAAQGSTLKANKLITDRTPEEKLLDVLPPIENNAVKSTLCESAEKAVANPEPVSPREEGSTLDPNEIKSSDRDVATTSKYDRSLANSLVKEDMTDALETTRQPLRYSDLKSRSEEIQNKAGLSVATTPGQAGLETNRPNWTLFDESSGDNLSVKTTPDRPEGVLLDSKSVVNMVNGSKQSKSVGEMSAEQPSKRADVPFEQGLTAVPTEAKPDKNWVSFDEKRVRNGEALPRAETALQTDQSRPDQKPISTVVLLSNASQAFSASMKVQDIAEANAAGTEGWVNFDEKPQVTPSQPAASQPSNLAQVSWVTFEDTKPVPKPDLTSLMISVGLSPQASPVAKSGQSPNPFVGTTTPQGANPFKPSEGVVGTNPFQIGENELLLMGGELTNTLPASSTTVQPNQPPVTQSVTQPGTGDAVVDLLDGLAAAATTPFPSAIEGETVEDKEEELLEEYPVLSTNNSWSLLLRFPDKKKRIGSREWKPVVIRLEGCTLQIYEDFEPSAAFREVALQGYFAFSTARLQSHEKGGKVHTVKLEYVKYTEGRKLNHKGNIEHIACTTPILKLGARGCFIVREFMEAVTHSLRFLPFYRDRGITYHYNEMFVDVDDDCNVLLSGDGTILKQGSKVLIKIRAFLTGDPECELVLNDAVVKRREEARLRNEDKPQRVHHWIKLQQCEFHKCVDKSKFEEAHAINFHPLDACTFELMRFQVKNTKPLPLEVKVSLSVLNAQRIELKAEIQLCQEKKMAKYARNNVVFRFPIPVTWVALFRTSKLFRGEKSIKSTRSHKTGIKSHIHNSKCSIVVSLGSAKYEPEYGAVVWRIEKLPFIHSKVPVDAAQTLTCRLDLPVGMECPADYKPHAEVEYDVCHALVSDTTVVAVKASNEILPEKWVCYRAFYHYDIDMDVTRPTSSPVRDVGCTQQ